MRFFNTIWLLANYDRPKKLTKSFPKKDRVLIFSRNSGDYVTPAIFGQLDLEGKWDLKEVTNSLPQLIIQQHRYGCFEKIERLTYLQFLPSQWSQGGRKMIDLSIQSPIHHPWDVGIPTFSWFDFCMGTLEGRYTIVPWIVFWNDTKMIRCNERRCLFRSLHPWNFQASPATGEEHRRRRAADWILTSHLSQVSRAVAQGEREGGGYGKRWGFCRYGMMVVYLGVYRSTM